MKKSAIFTIPMRPIQFSHVVPFLPVADIEATIAFYKEKLGFYDEWLWKNPNNGVVTDAGIRRDNLRLLFTHAPKFIALMHSTEYRLDVIWFVQSVDAVYEEYQSRGLTFVETPNNKPWGMREFTVQDLNGYCIRISEPLSAVKEIS